MVMGLAYSKEYLVGIVLWKYRTTKQSEQEPGKLEALLSSNYDKVGKDVFRKHCNLTPDLIRLYKEGLKTGLDFVELSCYNGGYE
jgi:hypothetical protein